MIVMKIAKYLGSNGKISELFRQFISIFIGFKTIFEVDLQKENSLGKL